MWELTGTPLSTSAFADLQYAKWVNDRREMVDRLSSGEIGYLHIRAMDAPSLQKFELDLAANRTKKALIIDQRVVHAARRIEHPHARHRHLDRARREHGELRRAAGRVHRQHAGRLREHVERVLRGLDEVRLLRERRHPVARQVQVREQRARGEEPKERTAGGLWGSGHRSQSLGNDDLL